MIFSLCSCANNEVPGLDEFEQLLDQSETENEENEPFADKVYIIIANNASFLLAAKASRLALEISEKTGVEAIVKYDNETTIVGDDDIELLLGDTNRIASKEALKNLRLGDYVCHWDKDKLILGGRYEAATLAAVDYFCNTVIHGASNIMLMNPDAHFEYFESYDVQNVTLNGYDLYDYTFVYKKTAENYEYEVAEILRNYIAHKTGYWLEIISDADVTSSTGKQILIDGGAVELLYDGTLEPTENGVALRGRDSFGLSLAAVDFADMLLESGKGNVTSIKGMYGKTERCSIGAGIMMCTDNADEEYLSKIIHGMADRLSPADVLVLKNVKAEIIPDVKNNIPKGYKLLEVEKGTNSYVLYNENTVKYIECKILSGAIDISLRFSDEGEIMRVVYAYDKYQSNDITYADAVIFENVDFDSISEENLKLVEKENCRLENDTRELAMAIGSNISLEATNTDAYNGSSCSRLFCTVNIKQKYSSALLQLAKAAE